MFTQEEIEISYQAMKDRYDYRKRKNGGTGMQNVLQLFMDYPDRIWWWSCEISGKSNSKNDWISHKGPARASDLAIFHPTLVEDRKVGRYSIYRARTENMEEIKKFLLSSNK